MGGDHGSYSFCAWYLDPTLNTSSGREMRNHLSALDARNREGEGGGLVRITCRFRIGRVNRLTPEMRLDVGDVQPSF